MEFFTLTVLILNAPDVTKHLASKAGDTLGDFIRRWPRSAYKIADICNVRYRRLNSPAIAKHARSRDFLCLLLRIASKANPSGWAILSRVFKTATSPRSAKKIVRCVRINRWRKTLAIFAGDQIRRNRRIKSPGVSPA